MIKQFVLVFCANFSILISPNCRNSQEWIRGPSFTMHCGKVLTKYRNDLLEVWPVWASICRMNSYPIGSMYGIYANIGGILMVNVTIYIAYMDPMGTDSCEVVSCQCTLLCLVCSSFFCITPCQNQQSKSGLATADHCSAGPGPCFCLIKVI